MTAIVTQLATNQFIINHSALNSDSNAKTFQSYQTTIAHILPSFSMIVIDPDYFKYSRTTSKYLKQFLWEDCYSVVEKIYKRWIVKYDSYKEWGYEIAFYSLNN